MPVVPSLGECRAANRPIAITAGTSVSMAIRVSQQTARSAAWFSATLARMVAVSSVVEYGRMPRRIAMASGPATSTAARPWRRIGPAVRVAAGVDAVRTVMRCPSGYRFARCVKARRRACPRGRVTGRDGSGFRPDDRERRPVTPGTAGFIIDP
jgi:hypothetical protein